MWSTDWEQGGEIEDDKAGWVGGGEEAGLIIDSARTACGWT